METTVQIVELGTNCRLQIGDAFVYVTYETLEDIVTKGEQIILNKSITTTEYGKTYTESRG